MHRREQWLKKYTALCRILGIGTITPGLIIPPISFINKGLGLMAFSGDAADYSPLVCS